MRPRSGPDVEIVGPAELCDALALPARWCAAAAGQRVSGA